MSMAPGEQRVLAAMERDLRRSDPELVTMLEHFEPHRRRDLVHHLGWALRRPRHLALAVLTCAVLGLVAVGVLMGGHAGRSPGVSCARPPAAAGTCPAAGPPPPDGCRGRVWPPCATSLTAPGTAPGAASPYARAAPADGPPGDGGGQAPCG